MITATPGQTDTRRDSMARMSARVSIAVGTVALVFTAGAGYAAQRATDGGGAVPEIADTPVITAAADPSPSEDPGDDEPEPTEDVEVIEGPYTDGDVSGGAPMAEDEPTAGVAVDEELSPAPDFNAACEAAYDDILSDAWHDCVAVYGNEDEGFWLRYENGTETTYPPLATALADCAADEECASRTRDLYAGLAQVAIV